MSKGKAMQAYGNTFARIYNERWNAFSDTVAPRIYEYFESNLPKGTKRTLIDLCCGTGRLSRFFLEKGYTVTAIDLSESMLEYARQNNIDFTQKKKVTFSHDNAISFSVNTPHQFVISTYDALNHLPDESSLGHCFKRVYEALLPGGVFVFDINTRFGLRNGWSGISVTDQQDFTMIQRSVYSEQEKRAYTMISGYSLVSDNLYERFEETIFNHEYSMDRVRTLLKKAGFRDTGFHRLSSLSAELDDPETERRVFVTTVKP